MEDERKNEEMLPEERPSEEVQPPVQEEVLEPQAAQGAEEPIAPPAPKGKKPLFIGVGLAVAALLVVGVLAKEPIMKQFFPKQYVISAIAQTRQQATEENETYRKARGYDLLMEEIAKGPSETNFDFQIQSIENPELGSLDGVSDLLGGLGFRGNAKISPEENKIQGSMGYYTGAGELLTFDGYFSDEEYAVAIPQLYDGYLSFNPQTVVEDYNASMFGRDNPMPPEAREDILFDLKSGHPFAAQSEAIQLTKDLLALTDSLYEKAQFSKGGRQTIPTPKGDFTGDLYLMQISEADFKAYCIELVNILWENEQIRTSMLKSFEENGVDDSEAALEEGRTALVEELERIEIPGGVQVAIGIDGEGLTRYAKFDATVRVEGEENPLEVLGLNFAEQLIGGAYLEVKYGVGDGNDLGMLLDYTNNLGILNGQQEEIKLLMDLGIYDAAEQYGSMLKVDYLFQYAPDQEGDNLLLVMDMDMPVAENSSIGLSAAGRMAADEQAKTVSVELSDMHISVEDYETSLEMSAKGTFTQKAIEAQEISLGEVERIEIFKLSDEEVTDFVYGAIMRLLMLSGSGAADLFL